MSNTTTRTRKAAAATKTATANITAARKAKADGSLNLQTGELKVGAAKKAPAKKATAKKAAATTEDKPKSQQTFEERDWTYLDEKDPSEQHVLLAKEINRRTEEIDINPKQVQAVLAMFPHFQRSATNKSRSGYHALANEIVEKRSEHMKLAHQEAREIMDGLVAQSATKKAAAKAPAKKAAASTRKTTTAKSVAAKKAPAKRTARKAIATTEAF